MSYEEVTCCVQLLTTLFQFQIPFKMRTKPQREFKKISIENIKKQVNLINSIEVAIL